MADAASGCMMPGTALQEGANVAAHIYQQVPQGGRQRKLPGGAWGPSPIGNARVLGVGFFFGEFEHTLVVTHSIYSRSARYKPRAVDSSEAA